MAESDKLTFNKAFEKLNEKTRDGVKSPVIVSSFAVPEILINESKAFNNLVGEKLIGKDNKEFIISQALQNIKFELDSKGAKVVSEAAIAGFEGCCYRKDREEDFIFNKPFYLFITKDLKSKPVLALRVNYIYC